ncbi:DUF484 family protein [Massilia sp. W12]|uniref:GGDEF domain-containing protein n=1 Tax=Massilia sp. W12 TaxID=3126507 RepID=UPI0030D5CC48
MTQILQHIAGATLAADAREYAAPEAVAPASEIERLHAENRQLLKQIDELVEQAAYNHQVMCKHQAFDLEIVGASSFPQLVTSILQTLPQISKLDNISLSLLDQDADIHNVMQNLGVDFEQFPNLIFVESAQDLGPFDAHEGACKPHLGAYEEALHAHLFPGAELPASVAVVPLLRNRSLIGSLNLGSADAARFSSELGTDSIEHMASIIAICLENVISNELLKYIGLTDSLTGIYNRRYVDRRLLEEVARARRTGYHFSAMYIDIDHFKHVNDSVGHLGGDEVLREVAARIKAELRQSDALGRFGGEEFVVLLVDADMESARSVAERIRNSMERNPFVLSTGISLQVTVSLGVATLIDDENDSVEQLSMQLLAQADHALYEAKQSGRNRVVSFQ